MLAVRISVVACLLLTACGGNPLKSTGGTVINSGTSDVPAEVARDLNAFTYADGVLKIDMQGVTSSGKLATFKRAPALDVASGTSNAGYEAYIYQDTKLTRSFLAYVAKNDRENLLAVTAADGGQFNEHNFGGRYVQLTAFTKPTTSDAPESGLFSYMGSYVGVFSPGDYSDGSAPRPPELRPYDPWVVKGTAQVNGDFAHGMVEGGITDRKLFDQDGHQITSVVIDDGNPATVDKPIDTAVLGGLVLRETKIADNGTFLGNVEFFGSPDKDVGDYAGAFGGTGATDVAGVLWLHPITNLDGVWESGAFNLPRCDMAGSSPLCVPR